MIKSIEYEEDKEHGRPGACFVDQNGERTPLFHSREFGKMLLSHALRIDQVQDEDAQRLRQELDVSDLQPNMSKFEENLAAGLIAEGHEVVPHLETTPPQIFH